MCGIAGIYNLSEIGICDILNVSSNLRHRGPDDEGYMISDSNNEISFLKGEETISELSNLQHIANYRSDVRLVLVHRRLSIIDLTSSGHQPMSIQENNLIIVYNGEIYNYVEIRNELLAWGYKFNTESDTEVVLNSYRHWSEKCVEHFIGMWSFVILDRKKNILFCSRDRFGIKPLYYVERKDFFVFASEIKAMLVVPQIKPLLHESKAIEFLVNGNQNFHNETFFYGINEIPPSHNLIYDLKNRKSFIYSYYSISSTEPIPKITCKEAISKLTDLISDSIHIHLRSDVPVGACLSGGLDSTTILAHVVKEKLPYRMSTFTASFPGDHVDETPYVKLLKKRYDFSDYYTYPDLKKLWEVADKFLWHQELPVQSTSMFAQWEVMKLAHENSIKVLLDGQGMDEISGGYSEFIGAMLVGHLANGRLLKLLTAVKDLRSNYRTSSILNELTRALFYYLPESLRYQAYSVRRLGPHIINQEYSHMVKGIKFEKRISNTLRETSLTAIQNILPVLLRYEDRSSMAFSIESRVPYLDHRMAEFCINLPEEMKVIEGWTKYLLRKSSEPHLPKEIIWRKEKFGFVTPEKIWTQEMKLGLTEFVNENKIPDIIDPKRLIKIINSRTDNKINLGEIWRAILFIKWSNVYKIN